MTNKFLLNGPIRLLKQGSWDLRVIHFKSNFIVPGIRDKFRTHQAIKSKVKPKPKAKQMRKSGLTVLNPHPVIWCCVLSTVY